MGTARLLQDYAANDCAKNHRDEFDDVLKACFDEGVEYERERIREQLKDMLSDEQFIDVTDKLEI